MDLFFDGCFVGMVVLGGGVYLVREVFVRYFMKLWNREKCGYERLLF